MNEYYQNMLKSGCEFQDYVADLLADKLFICVTTYNSPKYQLKGENKQGIEIKFDDRYAETGNIYIEIAEKSNAENTNFIKSGIYRSDNTWLYVIGNYNIIYIFGKKILVHLHNSQRYKEVEIPTSKGFLLPRADAEKYSLKTITP